ncbi:MAG: ATP-binding cassette domain-containing protein [Candidatus Aenigmarchaeota archaeon]|nr:ATP-binding cassette domain-containing protein [Candidatus Aenigmarchaeota archaeon]NIO44056.1 ATP-binding cassette domain-containing protein [Candidatus Aenigmarchaeota archaeon]
MKPIVELRNVTKEYLMGEVIVKAIDRVNLKIKKSESIALMGPSGSGKSTMLHLVGCLDRPTKGKILIDGKDVSNLSDNELAVIRRKKIGFIFQFFNLIPSFTALGNVELPMMFSRTPKRKEKAKELLKAVGLGQRLHHYPSQLSGGETQRVAIARSLANDPQIVLADEPTGNLDSKSGKEILEVLVRLNKEKGVTLLIVTHDNLIARHARRKIKLRDGKIVR